MEMQTKEIERERPKNRDGALIKGSYGVRR